MPSEFDVVVIGAGTGGYVAAIRAAQLGLKVAVVERQKALGGTCLLWGCIPTKALLEHAHALKIVQKAKDWGVTIGASAGSAQVGIDMTHVQARKDKIVTGLSKGVEFLFKKNKIDWIKGTARLTGPGKVDVFEGDKQTLEAKQIIIATGSQPRSVPGIEIDHKRIITSDEAIHLKEVPKSLVVMGSGAVGGGHSGRRAPCRPGGAAAQLRSRARLHVLRSRNRQRRPHRGRGQSEGLRRACGFVPLWRARPRKDGGGNRRLREDRRREEI